MALKQNGILINQMPLRQRGFDLGARNQFARTRAWWFTENTEDKTSGHPTGLLAPASGFLPLKAGGMNGRNSASLSIFTTGSGALGVNISGTATLAITLDGSGGLVVSGNGTASFAINTTGSVVAALFGTGTASMAVTTTATVTAKGLMLGDAALTLTAAAVLRAVGNMTGSTETADVLTNASIAAAVWSAVQASFNVPGTMGYLQTGGSGSGGGGLTVDQANQLKDIWQKEGLDPDTPITITKTKISIGDPLAPLFEILLTGDLKTITTMERQP